MAIHFVKKQARWPLFFIAFLKGSKHNYQLEQVLENFKYSFYFDGITLSEKVRAKCVNYVILKARIEWHFIF